MPVTIAARGQTATEFSLTSCAGASQSVCLATVVAMGALASYGAPEHGKLMHEVACTIQT